MATVPKSLRVSSDGVVQPAFEPRNLLVCCRRAQFPPFCQVLRGVVMKIVMQGLVVLAVMRCICDFVTYTVTKAVDSRDPYQRGEP